MTQKSTRTIDNLGLDAYISYERERKGFEERYVSESKNVAYQIQADIFEPIIVSDYQLLFDLIPKGDTWVILMTPPEYNDQRRRLFTYQLAPKLGPEEYLEMQIERIEDTAQQAETERQEKEKEDQKKKRLFSWEAEEDPAAISKEAATLIELLKTINILNKIMIEINAERYRYSKG